MHLRSEIGLVVLIVRIGVERLVRLGVSRGRVRGGGMQTPRHSSHIIYKSNGDRNSTPPQNSQLIVLISNSEQSVEKFIRELIF